MAAKAILQKTFCRQHAQAFGHQLRNARAARVSFANDLLRQHQGHGCETTRPFSSTVKDNRIIHSPHEDVAIPDATFTEFMFSRFKEFGDMTAVYDAATGRSYSFKELTAASIRVASALTRMGIRKGDRILMFSTNCPEYILLLLACGATGAVLSSSNPAYTAGELTRQLEHCRAATVVVVDESVHTVEQAVNSSEHLRQSVKDILVLGQKDGYRSFSTLLEDDGKAFPEHVDIRANDVIAIPYSSGTTGMPKGVMLSHRNIVANIAQSMKPMQLEAGRDKLLGVLPVFHIYGMVASQCCSIANGATYVSMPRFSPHDFLNIIQQQKITFLHLVPPLVVFLAKDPNVPQFDLTSVRTVVSGAAPLGEGICQQLATRMSANMVQAYGLTETSPIIAFDVLPIQLGTVGPLVSNTCGKVVNVGTEEVLPVGEVGEICIQGPQVMLGYLDNQKATDDMIVDGWLHTGDIGFFGSDGRLTITSRLKELIKYKGFQVPPAELESLLLSHPGVQDAAVLGVADEEAGELPKAYVVLKPGETLTEKQIVDFVKDNVSSYKQLRGGVQFIESIPKTPSGKILRLKLREF